MPCRRPLTPARRAVVALTAFAGLLVPALAAPAVGTGAAAPLPTAPNVVTEAEPLRLQIEELSPSVLSGDEEILIEGTVTNEDDEAWSTVNVQSFHSTTPITSAAQLAEAASLPVDSFVGERVTDVGTFATIPQLEPGESASFSAVVPAGVLGGGDGVYWVGVHALGETESRPRDEFADGRARTFVPVLSSRTRPLPAAMVLPLRAPVHHLPDGRIARPGAWARLLGPGGRLRNLLEAGREAGDRPVTWLVDPAVPVAARMLAAGNPEFSIEPLPVPETDDEDGGDGEDEGEPPTGEPLPETPPLPDPTDLESPGDTEVDALTPAEEAAAAAAQGWLEVFEDVVSRHPVLALPYGDVDASALQATAPELLEQARTRSTEVMEALGISATPALAAPDGYLSPEAIGAESAETVVLLSDRALAPPAPEDGEELVEGASVDPVPSTGRLLGHTFATTSSGVARGGPGPEPAAGPIAVRQRVVTEAALRLLGDDRSALIVSPPPSWDPDTGAAELFSTFDEGLLRLRPLADVVADDTSGGRGSPPPELDADALVYGDAQAEAQLPATNVRAAEALVGRSELVAGILARPSALVGQVTDAALSNVSYFARRRPEAWWERTTKGRRHLDDLLGQVRIDGPPRAILSSDQGVFGVTVFNDLDVPVAVHVEPSSAGNLAIEVANPVRLAPRSRRRLRVDATAARQGVEQLTLRVTDAEGVPLGASTTFPVRTAQVSAILWVIMGGGAAMLFGAIGVRLFRRVRAARHQEDPEA